MPTCVVPGCGRGPSSSLSGSSQVRLHSLPKDNTLLLQIWKERIANPRIEGSSRSKCFVCDRHFIKECSSPGTKRLRKFSLPTIACPGFDGAANIENSFLYPPKQLQPGVKNEPEYNASARQPEPGCSKELQLGSSKRPRPRGSWQPEPGCSKELDSGSLAKRLRPGPRQPEPGCSKELQSGSLAYRPRPGCSKQPEPGCSKDLQLISPKQVKLALIKVAQPTCFKKPQPWWIKVPPPEWLKVRQPFRPKGCPKPSQPDSPKPPQPDFPKPSQPDYPKPLQPDFPKPLQLDSPKPQQPDCPKPSQPDSSKPPQPDFPKPLQPDCPKPSQPECPKPLQPDFPKPLQLDSPKPIQLDSPKPQQPDCPKPSQPDSSKPPQPDFPKPLQPECLKPPQPQSSCLKDSSRSFPLFVDLTDSENEEIKIIEPELTDKNEPVKNSSTDEVVIINHLDGEPEDICCDPLRIEDTFIEEPSDNLTLKKKKVTRRINNNLNKQGLYSANLIKFARAHWIPRHLNVSKPVGFSNRQRLAWRICSYLEREIAKNKIQKRQSKFVEKNKIEVVKKVETIEAKEIKPIKEVNNHRTLNKISAISNPVLYKGQLRIIDEFVKSKNFHLLTSKSGLNPLAVKLLSLQMKSKLFCPLRQKFSVEDKIYCAALCRKLGLKTYKELGEYCALPPVKTLFNVINHVPFLPGVHRQVFDNLKSSVSKLDEPDKYCSIIFQEIQLSREVTVKKHELQEEQEDVVKDFDENIEECQEEKIQGDHVTVVMLRGLSRDWRQPVAFQVTEGNITADDLATLLKNVIIESSNTGFKIVATIFNKKETFLDAISLLTLENVFPVVNDEKPFGKIHNLSVNQLHEKYPKATGKSEISPVQNTNNPEDNITWNGGHVLQLNNQEISLLYNTSQLLRILRKKWTIYDISFSENGKIKQASWNHVIKLYEADEGNEETKFCPKLTNRHVIPEEFDKGSTKCSAQVFSQRVSSIMRCLGKMKASGFDSSAIDTADLLMFFDKLYDSLTGTSQIPQRGKPLRCAASVGSLHEEFWRISAPVLTSMRFLTPFKEESNVFHSWLETLESVKKLFNTLVKQKNLSSLPLGHLNCEPLESFAKYALLQDVHTINPSYEMFIECFKTLILCGDVTTPDLRDYHTSQLDPLRDYIYDEIPSSLIRI